MKNNKDNLIKAAIIIITGTIIGLVTFLAVRKYEEKELDMDYYG